MVTVKGMQVPALPSLGPAPAPRHLNCAASVPRTRSTCPSAQQVTSLTFFHCSVSHSSPRSSRPAEKRGSPGELQAGKRRTTAERTNTCHARCRACRARAGPRGPKHVGQHPGAPAPGTPPGSPVLAWMAKPASASSGELMLPTRWKVGSMLSLGTHRLSSASSWSLQGAACQGRGAPGRLADARTAQIGAVDGPALHSCAQGGQPGAAMSPAS